MSDYRGSHFDHNLFWKQGGNVSSLQWPNFTTWSEWRAEGQDAGSLIADPQLEWREEPALGGVAVPVPAASSPAWSLGFVAVDVGGVGPRLGRNTPPR